MASKHHIVLINLKVSYHRASRCWRSNNLRSCLRICDELSKSIAASYSGGQDDHHDHDDPVEQFREELARLKQLVWFLKIKCLAEDYYVNESLLLNEDDIEGDDRVETFTSDRGTITRSTANKLATTSDFEGPGLTHTAGSELVENHQRQRTAILTGRMSSVSSRQGSGRATTSYRPLTTSLTATQTAFSRSTRPLLKYSTSELLSRPIYEYLYNAQAVTNKCPDYRQCLEYLNLVQNCWRRRLEAEQRFRGRAKKLDEVALILLADDSSKSDQLHLGTFWQLSFGICYFNLRMNKQAEEHFKLAQMANQKHLDAYTWLIKVYLRTNQTLKVLKTCEEGLARSRNALLYNWMARVQGLVSDSYAANQSLRESLRFYPTNVEALANVGYFSFYSDRLEQSLRCFERINQLTTNHQLTGGGGFESSCELLNNLALCNLACGRYHRVLPLFQKALLGSPSKEMTSNIWYNISFVPLSQGLRQLVIACLRLALKNNSQNEEALNNLGVLKHGPQIDDQLHYSNRQELWGAPGGASTRAQAMELANSGEQRRQQVQFDEAEAYFSAPVGGSPAANSPELGAGGVQPEMLYNMALIKRRRGQFLSSARHCRMYLRRDPNNYTMRALLREIKQLIAHDS